MKNLRLLSILVFVFTNIYFAQAQNDQKKLEPEIVEVFFTDKNNKRFDADHKVSVNEKYIYMVVITKRAKGEKLVINLDEDLDYLYKRKYIKANDAIKFKIKKDKQKIKLVVFNSNKKSHQRIKKRALKKS